jgi:hypothetical protein
VNAARPSSTADRFKAAAASRRKDETGKAPAGRGATAQRTKPVRITVDLDPADYLRMRQLVGEMATRTGIPTLAHSVMWRAVLRVVEGDAKMKAAIADQITSDQE